MTVLDLPAFFVQVTTFRSARLIALPSPTNSQTVRMRPDEFSQKSARSEDPGSSDQGCIPTVAPPRESWTTQQEPDLQPLKLLTGLGEKDRSLGRLSRMVAATMAANCGGPRPWFATFFRSRFHRLG